MDGGGDDDEDANCDGDNGAIRGVFTGCHTLMGQVLSVHPFSRWE